MIVKKYIVQLIQRLVLSTASNVSRSDARVEPAAPGTELTMLLF